MLITNQEVIVNYDNNKRKKIILFGSLLTLASAIFIYIIFTAAVIKIFYLAMFILIFGASVFFILKTIREMNSKDQVGLVLNNNWLKFNGTISGKKAGEINWSDIETVENHVAFGTNQLYLKLKNPSKYIHEVSKIDLANSGIFINSTELQISAEELESLVRESFEKYKQNQPI